jgi:riboflavin transporter FmnP
MKEESAGAPVRVSCRLPEGSYPSGVFFSQEATMKHEKMKKLTVLAMLSAIAYVAVALLRFPVVLFLSYEPKDVVIAIGGFLYGPLAALGISLVVSFIEMLTISSTGWIGFVMNFLSSAAFAGTAALLYRKKRTQGSAIAGLFGGALLMTVLMLLWNYLITPLYMHTARADVAAMLVPVFLPFNLLKGVLVSLLTFFLYKRVEKLFFRKKHTA